MVHWEGPNSWGPVPHLLEHWGPFPEKESSSLLSWSHNHPAAQTAMPWVPTPHIPAGQEGLFLTGSNSFLEQEL